MKELGKLLIDLGVGLPFGLLAVWFIGTTTPGGTILLIVTTVAVVKLCIEVFRWFRGPSKKDTAESTNATEGKEEAEKSDAADGQAAAQSTAAEDDDG